MEYSIRFVLNGFSLDGRNEYSNVYAVRKCSNNGLLLLDFTFRELY